jgi:hypothetical protein
VQYANNAAGRAAVKLTVSKWLGYAQTLRTEPNLGSWIRLHESGALQYNCGGITGPGWAYGYGADYVTEELLAWVRGDIPTRFTLDEYTHWYPSGEVDKYGNYQYLQDYCNLTTVAKAKLAVAAKTVHAAGNTWIAAGNYRVVLNYHLYVGAKYENEYYNVESDEEIPDWAPGVAEAWPTE